VDKLSQTEWLLLRSLARLSPSGGDWLNVSDVMRYAESLYTLRVPSDQWQAKLLKPLEANGWIELERGTTGRGAKSGRVRGTKKFASDYVKALLEQEARKLPPELRSGRDRPLKQVLEEMASSDTYKKGLALEFLALRIADLLDLAPKKWRLRSGKTGGAEVDLVIEGARLVFTRWQVQCKNTSAVHVDDLAKEIGLAVLLKSQVIMIVTTGKIGKSVRGHARKINEETALQVVLIDGQDLKNISENTRASGLALADLLNAQASEAMKQKEPQLFEETD
jgi:restriction endonuclease